MNKPIVPLNITITPEAKALVAALRENNDRLAECYRLLKACHASIRELPAEFLGRVGLESRGDVEGGIIDGTAPSATTASELMGHVDHL